MLRFTRTLILVLGLCPGLAFAHPGSDAMPTDVPGMVEVLPNSFAHIDGVLDDLNRPAKQTLALEVGPKLIEVKAFYLEKRQDVGAPAEFLNNAPHATQWGRYFDVFAMSSQFGGKLIGEGELAYSTLGMSMLPEQQQPSMARVGLKGTWGKAGYGISHRSFGQGFVSVSGMKVEHPRDENQMWAEYNFGLFQWRAGAGETWEENSAANQITLTRSAATSFHLSKPGWSASLSSAYSLIGQEQSVSQKTAALTNGLTLVLRPAAFLTIEPNLGFKQEWDRTTGLQIDTPSAGVALSCTPSRDFKLVGRAAYAKGMSADPLKDAATVHTTTSLNWNMGKSFLGEQSLSFQLDYRNELRPNVPESSQANLTGSIQFRIAEF